MVGACVEKNRFMGSIIVGRRHGGDSEVNPKACPRGTNCVEVAAMVATASSPGGDVPRRRRIVIQWNHIPSQYWV